MAMAWQSYINSREHQRLGMGDQDWLVHDFGTSLIHKADLYREMWMMKNRLVNMANNFRWTVECVLVQHIIMTYWENGFHVFGTDTLLADVCKVGCASSK